MNDDALASLGERWPNDKLPSESFGQALSELSGECSLWQTLIIDAADSQALGQFATANGLTYTAVPSEFVDSQQTYTAAWKGLSINSNEPKFVHLMAGAIFGYPTTMCLEYRPSSVQQRDTADQQYQLNRRSIIRVTLPKLFPQLVLDSNKNDGGVVSTIPCSIKTNQKVTLEGNFGQYFDFYAPRGIQANSLSVLAPNFMETLIKLASSFDVEFYGRELILITKEPLYSPKVMQSARTALEVQLQYLNNLMQSRSYTPLKLPFDHLEYSYFNGPTVIKVGRFRINPLGQLGGIALLFVLFLAFIILSK